MNTAQIESLKTRVSEAVKLDTTKIAVVPFDTLGKEMIEKMNRATRRSLLRGDILVISDIGLLLAVRISLHESGFTSTRVKFIAHTKEVFDFAVWLGIDSKLVPYDKIHLFFSRDKGYNYVTATGIIMKFDVVIGNPPYGPSSSHDRGGNGSANKIWHLFIEHAFEVLNEDGTLCMITPTGWRGGAANLKRQHRFAQDRMFDTGVACWADVRAPIDYFPMVGGSIGIDWWQINKNNKQMIPQALVEERILPRTMQAADIKRLENWILSCKSATSAQSAFHLTIKGNDKRKFSCLQKSSAGDSSMKWRHLNTGGNTRKNLFDWYDRATVGFNTPKVIVHDSSGPEPFIDIRGEYGCGTHASAYPALNMTDATDIYDFFKSNLCSWIADQFCEKGSLGYPVNLFKTIPKNWRSI